MSALELAFLLFALVAPSVAGQPARGLPRPTCDDGASVRRRTGPEPLTSRLWTRIGHEATVPVWEAGTFHEQEFRYIGSVRGASRLHLVWFSTTWGQGCRATNRLLVYDAGGHLLGHYGLISAKPVRVSGAAVAFDDGTSVSFRNGIPEQIDDTRFTRAAGR